MIRYLNNRKCQVKISTLSIVLLGVSCFIPAVEPTKFYWLFKQTPVPFSTKRTCP